MFQRAIDKYSDSIQRQKPIPAYLGAFVNGAFTTAVANDPSLTYVRYLDSTPTTAKHRNKINLDTDNENIPISLFYDEHEQLAILDIDPAQAGAVIAVNPNTGVPAHGHAAPAITFTPTTPGDWTDPDPATVQAALDKLAAAGGGGGLGYAHWDPKAPPASPSAFDDEFNDATFNTTLWDDFNHGARTLAHVENDNGLLFYSSSLPAAEENYGFYQAAPASGDFTIDALVALTVRDIDTVFVGIALFEDATQSADALFTYTLQTDGTAEALSIDRWTDYDTIDFNEASRSYSLNFAYLRVSVHDDGGGAGTYRFYYSTDGENFMYAGGYSDFYPQHIGIIQRSLSGGVELYTRIRFFRVRSVLANDYDPAFGQLLN